MRARKKKPRKNPRRAEVIDLAQEENPVRHHDLGLEWCGVQCRFSVDSDEMYAGVLPGIDNIRLVSAFLADKKNDEWVNMPRTILNSAREDKSLMNQLLEMVRASERDRYIEDALGDFAPLEPEPEEEYSLEFYDVD